jgi:hypothetical protein
MYRLILHFEFHILLCLVVANLINIKFTIIPANKNLMISAVLIEKLFVCLGRMFKCLEVTESNSSQHLTIYLL